MNEEGITGYEKIMFDIAMQLYDEFNDKLCEINDHLGDIYSYRDLEDVEKAEKEREIALLRNAVKEQEKVIDEMAKYLADCDFDECCAEIPEPCLGCSWEDYEPHINCIKQYFINKVTENKE